MVLCWLYLHPQVSFDIIVFTVLQEIRSLFVFTVFNIKGLDAEIIADSSKGIYPISFGVVNNAVMISGSLHAVLWLNKARILNVLEKPVDCLGFLRNLLSQVPPNAKHAII